MQKNSLKFPWSTIADLAFILPVKHSEILLDLVENASDQDLFPWLANRMAKNNWDRSRIWELFRKTLRTGYSGRISPELIADVTLLQSAFRAEMEYDEEFAEPEDIEDFRVLDDELSELLNRSHPHI